MRQLSRAVWHWQEEDAVDRTILQCTMICRSEGVHFEVKSARCWLSFLKKTDTLGIVPRLWNNFFLQLLLILPPSCCLVLPGDHSELGQGRSIYLIDEGIVWQLKLLNPDTCRTPTSFGGWQSYSTVAFATRPQGVASPEI